MRVLIADAHELLRDTLSFWLKTEGIEAVCAADIDAVLTLLSAEEHYDLVLLDYAVSGMNGFEGLRRVQAAREGIRIALMFGYAPREALESALILELAGLLPKTLPAKAFVHAVRFMMIGEKYVPFDFVNTYVRSELQHPLLQKFTPRELQMLQRLCEGSTNKEIARDLGIQEPTVKMHLKTLFRKIGAENRIQAAMFAMEMDLFQPKLP